MNVVVIFVWCKWGGATDFGSRCRLKESREAISYLREKLFFRNFFSRRVLAPPHLPGYTPEPYIGEYVSTKGKPL